MPMSLFVIYIFNQNKNGSTSFGENHSVSYYMGIKITQGQKFSKSILVAKHSYFLYLFHDAKHSTLL